MRPSFVRAVKFSPRGVFFAMSVLLLAAWLFVSPLEVLWRLLLELRRAWRNASFRWAFKPPTELRRGFIDLKQVIERAKMEK